MTDIEQAMVHYDGNGDMPYCDLVWQALKEKRDRDNPRPLTLEQLKGRDGKPVWIIDGMGYKMWALVNKEFNQCLDNETGDYDMDFYGMTHNNKLHVSGWIAYDYPPKEG